MKVNSVKIALVDSLFSSIITKASNEIRDQEELINLHSDRLAINDYLYFYLQYQLLKILN